MQGTFTGLDSSFVPSPDSPVTAPYVIDGAMDGPSFLAYVKQVLAPTLRKRDIVFMDNLRTHKIDGVREAIEAVGAKVRYLPAYSPDLNPMHFYSGVDICTQAVRKLLSTCRIRGVSHIKRKLL